MVGPDLKTPREPPAWLKAAARPSMLLYLLMVPTLWAVVSLVLLIERQRSVDMAIQQGSDLARLFEENTASMLRGVDRTLLVLRQEYEENPVHADLGRLLRRITLNDNLNLRFAIVSPDGDARGLIAHDGTFATAYVGDRDYFQRQRDTTSDDLIIAKPPPGRFSNEWALILSRRLRKLDGSFDGLMGGMIGTNFIGDFFNTIDVGAHGSVILRDLNGMILASSGTVAPAAGRQVMQPALREALTSSPTGYYWGGGAVDGVNRLVSYRTSQMLPAIVMVGLAESDIFAGFYRIRTISVFSAGILDCNSSDCGFRGDFAINNGLTAAQVLAFVLKSIWSARKPFSTPLLKTYRFRLW